MIFNIIDKRKNDRLEQEKRAGVGLFFLHDTWHSMSRYIEK